jgi:hypothetical protein
LPELCSELIEQHGFGEKVVHTRRKTPLPFALQGICGHGNDRSVEKRSLSPADHPRCLKAVHDRHVAVHQDEVVFLLVECLQGLISMHNHIGMTPQLTKHDGRHKTVGFIVLGDENPESLQPLGAGIRLVFGERVDMP